MNFAEQLRELGYRVTPQRQIILETVQTLGGHRTAAEIHKHVVEVAPAIDLATVYRALNLLNELNIVHSSRIGGQTIYEFTGDEPHHHLICDQCGRVQYLGDHHFKEMLAHMKEEHFFHANLTHLTINGMCQDCFEAAG